MMSEKVQIKLGVSTNVSFEKNLCVFKLHISRLAAAECDQTPGWCLPPLHQATLLLTSDVNEPEFLNWSNVCSGLSK